MGSSSGVLCGGIRQPAITSPTYQIKHTTTVLVVYCQLIGGFDEFTTFCCHVMVERSTCKQSPLVYGCNLSFKFTREISIEKTEICNHQVHL
jgi:hypothetical protein